MATYQTYTTIGIREDLIDVITNIAPVDTWFTSNSGSGRASNTYHEWQTDTLAAAAENAIVEGADATAGTVTPTVRAGNYCQILRKVFQISDTNEAVNAAGRDSESAYQTTQHMKMLARDIEYALVINSASASGASATARKMLGVEGWITTTVETGSATTDETLTEAMLNDCLQDIWAQGGKPSNVLCGSWQKRKIDGFTTNTRNIEADESKLVAAVDIYKSSFGVLLVRLHHQINTTIPGKLIILGDMGLWKKAWLRPIKKEKLARTGGSSKYMMEAELTLESRQQAGSGKITELATS